MQSLTAQRTELKGRLSGVVGEGHTGKVTRELPKKPALWLSGGGHFRKRAQHDHDVGVSVPWGVPGNSLYLLGSMFPKCHFPRINEGSLY